MTESEGDYLAERLERVVELLNDGNVHMAISKLLADISALRGSTDFKEKI